MQEAIFEQLVANIRQDGCMTQLPLLAYAGKHPLVPGSKPEDLECVSGNHRTRAAIEAGIVKHACQIVEQTDLTLDEKRSIQLSHNAIAGEDDKAILKHLYAGLDLSLKRYSGLTDNVFGDHEIDVDALGLGGVRYREMFLLFLPEIAEQFLEVLDRSERSSDTQEMRLASLDQFDELFDTLIRVKGLQNIHNTSTALWMLGRLANERMDQLAEVAEQKKETSDGES